MCRGTLRLTLAVLAVLLLAAVPAHAGEGTFGSFADSANSEHSNGFDITYWSDHLVAPEDGQVVSVRIRGTGGRDPRRGDATPKMLLHLQTLHPVGGGSLQVELSSGGFDLTNSGNPADVTTFEPTNMCVHRGDVLGLNTYGGFEHRWDNHQGIPVQFFLRGAGDSRFYARDDGTKNGDTFPAGDQRTMTSQLLLMEARFVSGRDATQICPGGFKEFRYEGMTLDLESVVGSNVRLRLGCNGAANDDSCVGTVDLRGEGLPASSKSFSVKRGDSDPVEVPLNDATRAELNRKGSLDLEALLTAGNKYEGPFSSTHPVELKLPGYGVDGASIKGSSSADTLCGGPGKQTIDGAAGNDTVFGDMCPATRRLAAAQSSTDGPDNIKGGGGNDKLYGGGGNDTIDGGGGDDRIDGGSGKDKLSGRAGNDKVAAVDGSKDTIECGSGRKDSVTADKADKVHRSCEKVKRKTYKRPAARSLR